MTIYRDGKPIELTDKEVRFIVRNDHELDVRYEVKNALSVYEEDGIISFENYDSGIYNSSEDARSDFIESVVEKILEYEDNDERTPRSHRYVADFDSEVYDEAEICGYLAEEE